MQITARLPLLFRGRPQRTKDTKFVFVSHDVEWDLPEVSISDMPVAFESRHGFERVEDGMTGPRTDYRYDKVERNYVLRELDGELYVRVAGAGADIAGMFALSFPTDHPEEHGGVRQISFNPELFRKQGNPCPLSMPVYAQLRWHQRCNQVKSIHDPSETWPVSIATPSGQIARGPNSSRNFVTFDQVLPKLTDYDHAEYEANLDMYPRHLSRFVVADGELWMKTPPPAIYVRGWREMQKASAVVSLALAPDSHLSDLTTATFALSARDEAMEYARRLVGTMQKDHLERGDVIDLTVDYDAYSPELFDYDHQAEELRRISCGLAVESHRFLTRNADWARKRFSEEVIQGVAASYAEVMDTDYVSGKFGDASDWLDTNAAIWKKTRRQGSVYQFGTVETGDYLLERARELDDNKTIDLPLLPRPRIHG